MTEFKVGDRVRLPWWGDREYLEVRYIEDDVLFGWSHSGDQTWPSSIDAGAGDVTLLAHPAKRYIVEHRPPRKGDRYLSYVGDVREVLADWAQPAPVIIEELS